MANIILGLDNVAKMVKPAIRKPKVVMEKLNPIDDQSRIFFSNAVALSSNTIEFKASKLTVTIKMTECAVLLGSFLHSLYTSHSDFSFVSSAGSKL
ncbi:hypothetical protein CGI69_18650 [Vibrio parahaemolyticus]|nr:hypothetical protein CGI69_18650 [Vibrio parahaemolyticus]